MASRTKPYPPELRELEERHPTLPAALEFVERAATWDVAQLADWLEENFVAPRRMARAALATDPVIGVAPLRTGVRPSSARIAKIEDVPRICANARAHVVDTLRRFIATPIDERFLQSAIFGGRVHRVKLGNASSWVPCPKDTDALHDIALTLFVCDILARREFYEQNLCVCEVCGDVSFDRAATTQARCLRHPLRTDATSGFAPSRSE